MRLFTKALAGNQTLLLNAQGAAVGGALNLNSRYVSNLTGLVVPKNVAVDAIGFNSATPLMLVAVSVTLAQFMHYKQVQVSGLF